MDGSVIWTRTSWQNFESCEWFSIPVDLEKNCVKMKTYLDEAELRWGHEPPPSMTVNICCLGFGRHAAWPSYPRSSPSNVSGYLIAGYKILFVAHKPIS